MTRANGAGQESYVMTEQTWIEDEDERRDEARWPEWMSSETVARYLDLPNVKLARELMRQMNHSTATSAGTTQPRRRVHRSEVDRFMRAQLVQVQHEPSRVAERKKRGRPRKGVSL